MVAEWYRDAFDDLYLTVYRHRDGEEASRLIRWLGPKLRLDGTRVLDLACGAGRFLQPLRAAGAREIVGLDLSRPLLDAASDAHGGDGFSFVRADMRHLPLATASFDVVVSMFTSLGYFADDAENRRVFAEMARVARPRARLAVDVLNPRHLRANLVPESTREVKDYRIHETREIRDGRIVKHVSISRRDGGHVRRYDESVRLLDESTLVRWAITAGLRSTGSHGDYDGGPVLGEASPRLILTFARDDDA